MVVHMEFCLILNMTMGGKLAVTWLRLIATRCVSFASTLNTREQVLATHRKISVLTLVKH